MHDAVPLAVLADVLRLHPAIVLLIDPHDGSIVDASAAAERYYGWSHEQLRERTVHDLNSLTEGEVALEMARAERSGQHRFAFRHRNADGNVRDVHVTSGPIDLTDPDGTVRTWLMSVVHDVDDLAGIRHLLRLRDRALEVAHDALVLADRDGTIVWCNPAFTALTGYDASESIGRTPGDLLASGEQDRAFYDRMWATLTRGETWRGRLMNRRKDGTRYHEEMVITPLDAADDGVTTHFIAVKRDVGESVQREQDLERWEAVFRNVRAGVVVADPDTGEIRMANPAYAAMHGTTPDALLGRRAQDLYAPHDRPTLKRALATVGRTGHHLFEADHVRSDGSIVPVSVDLTWTRLSERPTLIATVQDRSHVLQLEEDLQRSRGTDPLTGLPNREGLRRASQVLLARHARHGAGMAVVFAGLDGFQAVNDSLGHEVGDAVLREVARRFGTVLRTGDVLGRFGGDAFVMLAADLTAPEHAEQVAQRLRATLIEPIAVDGRSIVLDTGVGLALVPDDGTVHDALVSHAEAALHAAKTAGSGQVRFYDPSLQAQAEDRLTLRTELTLALQRDELWLAYQPLVDLESGAPVACEALVRWEHPTLGTVSPGRFVPEAERTGQIVEIGRFVRQRALRDLTAWDAAGLQVPRVAVNLSAAELADPTLFD
ncbi:MAG: PAS domain S-box protein, partial [Trueperaceae bacterium]